MPTFDTFQFSARAMLPGMGEQTRVTLDAKTIRDLGASIGHAIADNLRRQHEPEQGATPTCSDTTHDHSGSSCQGPTPVHVEPWHIFGPREQAVMAAYRDDAQALRFVRVDREQEVPKGWHKLYVQRPA